MYDRVRCCALWSREKFIPLLGYYIQRPPKKEELHDRGNAPQGFLRFYRRLGAAPFSIGGWSWQALSLLVIGGFSASH